MSMKKLRWRYGDAEVATQPEQLLGCLESENPHVARFVLTLHSLYVRCFVNNFWEPSLMKTSSDKPSSLKLGVATQCVLVQGTAPTFQFGDLLQEERFYGALKGFVPLFYKLLLVQITGFLLLLCGMQEILMTQQS